MNQADETFAFMLTILVIIVVFSLIIFFTKINFERERKKNVFTNIAVLLYKKLDDKTKTILFVCFVKVFCNCRSINKAMNRLNAFKA